MDQFLKVDTIKVDTNGWIIFSPWGDAGAGYFLPDTATHQRALRLEWVVFAGRCLLFILLLLVQFKALPFTSVLLMPLPLLLWYAAASRSLVRGLTVARERPLFRDYCATSSDAVGFPLLLTLFIFTFLFAWVSGVALSGGDMAFGIIGSVIFGGCASFCAYLLRIKWERTRQTKRGQKAH